ncbi:MAG: hypothetical protein QM715_00480 [Nibricoccus sp.]
MSPRTSVLAVKWLGLTLAAGLLLAWPPVSSATDDIVVNGDASYSFTANDLAAGPGSNFSTQIVIGTTFNLLVTSDGPCVVMARRSASGWLTAGTLWVQVKSGETFGEPKPIDITDQTILTSPTPLTNQLYVLRYVLRNVTVGNAPRTYSAAVTFTVSSL